MKLPAILICAALISAPAFADDAKPAPKPTCGNTIQECQEELQTEVLHLNKQITALQAMLQAAQAQRNAANDQALSIVGQVTVAGTGNKP